MSESRHKECIWDLGSGISARLRPLDKTPTRDTTIAEGYMQDPFGPNADKYRYRVVPTDQSATHFIYGNESCIAPRQGRASYFDRPDIFYDL